MTYNFMHKYNYIIYKYTHYISEGTIEAPKVVYEKINNNKPYNTGFFKMLVKIFPSGNLKS